MPKRTDLHKILVIGSGPIVIGQAAEFDYAGTPVSYTHLADDHDLHKVDLSFFPIVSVPNGQFRP